MAGAVDGLADGFEDLEGAVVGFLGASFCLLKIEVRLVFFLGGSLGIFFFSSGIVGCFGARWNAQYVAVAGEVVKGVYDFSRKWQCGDINLVSDIMQHH